MRKNLVERAQGKSARRCSNRGFTLMELMVGATLTTAVIAAAGYGVASMISTSTASNSRSEIRAELGRSNDFIATEIRESSGIVKDVSVASELPATSVTAFQASYSGKVDDSTIKKVLMIKTTGATPIVYFVAKPTTGSWKGPRVVYRWGPAFNANGTYSNVNTPSAWVSEVLVDQIQNASGTDPSCPTDSMVNGDSGFYICVDSLGKSAQIFQNGKISKVLGASENYEANTNIGVRKITVTPSNAVIASGAAAPPWTLDDGVVTVNDPLTMSVRYLGGDIVCGDPTEPIPTFGSVKLKTGGGTPTIKNLTMTAGADTSFSDVPANTVMTVSGYAKGNSGSGDCDGDTLGPYVSTSTTQVRALKDGDSVPSIPGYLGQASIDAVLTSASANPLTGKPIVDTGTKKIVLAKNQVIYLFEFGSTDPDESAFDLQDMVVLATFTPT
jgi:Tfp pilus assembly protein FimT